MRLEPTGLAGLTVVCLERRGDERGTFARTFDAELFAAAGLDATVVQCNTSSNTLAHTLRGMHYQRAPHGETKLVRVTRGAIFDVAVDLRPDSVTYCRWFGLELRAEGEESLFIPDGFAHGFQTLSDDAEVSYQMGAPYVAEAADGVRWDDPAFGIEWPAAPRRIISERDAAWPDFHP
ncbi:MAG: dTDP-4-dehydrorhamnose 3,5-epimerase [Solirubrobacteraceae bacterium]|jgi:dTDP-4-dehydrorhamnose 3,5-epimerase|nr:dTDP-4-dehydrorhamnose 3,5-epimerase [Solirubrobacteraceae bacterium]